MPTPGFADTWGTVASIASAVLSGPSLIFALYIILRDRNDKRRTEAEKVVSWIERVRTGSKETDMTTISAAVYTFNGSSFPIIAPVILERTFNRRETKALNRKRIEKTKTPPLHTGVGRASDGGDVQAIGLTALAPGAEITRTMRDESNRVSIDYIRFWLAFRDPAGRYWCRDLNSSALLRSKSRRMKREYRGRRLWRASEVGYRNDLGLRTGPLLAYAIDVWSLPANVLSALQSVKKRRSTKRRRSKRNAPD